MGFPPSMEVWARFASCTNSFLTLTDSLDPGAARSRAATRSCRAWAMAEASSTTHARASLLDSPIRGTDTDGPLGTVEGKPLPLKTIARNLNVNTGRYLLALPFDALLSQGA